MKKNILLTVALATLVAFAGFVSCKSSAEASSSKVLKFNLEKGAGYDYEMVWDMKTEVMGQETKMSFGGQYSVKVVNEDAGIKTLTGTYRSFRMNVSMMGVEIDIDTEKPGQVSGGGMPDEFLNVMKKMFNGIIGHSFTMKVNEEGKLLEVTGFREMMSGMIDSITIDPGMKEQIMASMSEQFSDESVKDMFSQVFTIFPNKEIKKGDTWDKSFSTGGKMGANFKTEYKVLQIEGDHVTLDAKTHISPLGGENDAIEGEQTGTLIIDSKTGLMVNGEFDQRISTRIEGGMSVKMEGKGRIKGKAN